MNLLLSKRLRYFIVAMETRCLNNAAEQLCITRSPLGKVICDLESHLGSQLFVRRYNKLEPTEFAETLYLKLKPVYDTLLIVEDEFGQVRKISTTEVLFDMSVPEVQYRHFVHQIRKLNIPVLHRRLCINGEDLNALAGKNHALLYSCRTHPSHPDLAVRQFGEEPLCLLYPENIDEVELQNTKLLSSLPLMLKKNDCTPEIRGFLTHLLKDRYPGLCIRESGRDMMELLYSVAAGKALLMLPRHLAQFFQPPGVKIKIMDDLRIHTSLLMNKKIKINSELQQIIHILQNTPLE